MALFDVIKDYKKVCIYRHINPDMDAYGSQYGLASIIKQYDSSIQVMVKGDHNEDIVRKMQLPLVIDEFNDLNDCLAIVVDTAIANRIDNQDYLNCASIIKIDHHIVVESYGQINIEDSSSSSTCQMIAKIYQDEFKQLMNETAATYLYYGMIADSNRFMYRNTGPNTFSAAGYLVSCGINIEKIYQTMYTRSVEDLNVQKYILNKYQVANRVAYYILTQEDLDFLKIERSRGSDYVNILSNIEEFDIWLAITENTSTKQWRVSIRSRSTVINEIAAKYNGGGHQLASGATLDSIEILDQLLIDLNNEIGR